MTITHEIESKVIPITGGGMNVTDDKTYAIAWYTAVAVRSAAFDICIQSTDDIKRDELSRMIRNIDVGAIVKQIMDTLSIQ